MKVSDLIKELNQRFNPNQIVKAKILIGLGVEDVPEIYCVIKDLIPESDCKKELKRFEADLHIVEIDD